MPRHRLETLVVGLAAECATAVQLAELRNLFGHMDAAVWDDTAEHYADLKTCLHVLVSDASCAPCLPCLALCVGPLMPISVCGWTYNSHAEHYSILASLKARDSVGAGATTGQHIDNAHRKSIATPRTVNRMDPVSLTDEQPAERIT